MLPAVFCWALTPLFFALSGGLGSPFLFGSLWRLGTSLGILLLFPVLCPSLLRDRSFFPLVRGNLLRLGMLAPVLCGVQYSFYSWSAGFIDISVVVVLSELWPLVIVLLLSWLLGDGGGYRVGVRVLFPLLCLAFLGASLSVAGESGGFRVGGEQLFRLLLGVLLALLSLALGVTDAFTFRWGRDLTRLLRAGGGSAALWDSGVLVLCLSLLAYGLSGLPGVALMFGLGLARGESISLGTALVGVLGGMTVHLLGNFLFRVSNLTTTNLGVNALGHLSPALALLLLGFFSRVDVARPSWLVLGMSGVLASNLLIGLGRGQRSLPPLAVWGWGVLVYLADFPAGLFLFLAGAVPTLPFLLPGGLGWRPGRPGRDFLSRWTPGGLGLVLGLVLVMALLLMEQRGLLPVSV